ncbi:MAG TPA: hypothetical protein VE974_00270 [Thermoanaerobaculia bacterium]|nr:hypothetical protein [Thermoanaerobaculia bacterium]
MMKKLTNSSLAAFGLAALLLTGACATQGGGDPAMNPTVSADARDEADVDASENLIAGGAPLNTTTETVVTTNTTATVDQSLSVDTNQSMTSSSNLDAQSTADTDTTSTTTETRTRMRKD